MDKKIKQLFELAKVDGILLRTLPQDFDAGFFYFTKLPVGFLSNNFLFLSKTKKPLLVRTVLDPEVKSRILRVKSVKKRDEMKSLLKRELKGEKVGLNMSLYSVAALKRLKKALPGKRFVDISQQLEKVREVKESWEIQRIERAAKTTDKVLHKILDSFRRGMTEKQLALNLEFALRKATGENVAFPPIVANARNAAFPHHVPSDRKIKKGLLLIDCGARFKGYCGDLTRVFSVGRASAREKALYETVFQAKQLGQDLCVEGCSASDVFNDVSKFLKKNAGQALVHGLGHGLGLKAHDAPSGFLQESKDVLKKNMVLTVEPGVYLRSLGIRIEDDVVVGKHKFRALSRAPKELISL